MTLLGAELLLLLLQLRAESLVAARTVGRLVPEILLVIGIWRGNRVASGILGTCFVLVVLVALAVVVFDVWPWSADLAIGTWATILGAWAAVLFRSTALRAYMQHQRD